MHKKTIIIASSFFITICNCFSMESPKNQRLINTTEHAALFKTLAHEAQQIILDEKTDLKTNNKRTLKSEAISKKRQCPICKKNVSHLPEHIRIHAGEKPFQCEHCNYSCIRRSTLISHIHTHTGEKPYHCNQCDYSSSFSGNLTEHMHIHTGEKPHHLTNAITPALIVVI